MEDNKGEPLVEAKSGPQAYPVDFRFAVFDVGAKVSVTDARGEQLAFVQQKAFRLKEDVSVFASEAQEELLYRITTEQILDISATYTITDAGGNVVGTLTRNGARSFWRASYEIKDTTGAVVARADERNPWVKLIDGTLGEIPFIGPVLGLATGYFLNPTYDLEVPGGERGSIVKHRSLLEGRFSLQPAGETTGRWTDHQEKVLLPAVTMIVLLERDRG